MLDKRSRAEQSKFRKGVFNDFCSQLQVNEVFCPFTLIGVEQIGLDPISPIMHYKIVAHHIIPWSVSNDMSIQNGVPIYRGYHTDMHSITNIHSVKKENKYMAKNSIDFLQRYYPKLQIPNGYSLAKKIEEYFVIKGILY